MKYVLLCLLLLSAGRLFSQTVITGKIINRSSQPIAAVNIVITNKDQLTVLAFSISDKNGMYKINYSGRQDSVSIKLSCIGYANIVKTIANTSQILNAELQEKITALPSVEVKARPISVAGDTVNYNVASFSTNPDRSIGDVIAKLPGFEVDANGGISYNGKAISNYYINGLDLLETRYGIANNNISHNLVDKVQLLENHQPIKILDSLKISTTPALNIVLKKKAVNQLIGIAKAGLGFTPVLTDDEIVAMQFRNRAQFIGAYKYNNAGQILNNEIKQQATIQDANEPQQEKVQEDILSIVSFPNPLLQERRYRFNDNHLLHFSALKLLKNTAQLKFSVAYLKDHSRISGSNTTRLFLPADTITLIENQENSNDVDKVSADVYYSLNQKNKYVKNALKLQFDLADEEGLLKNSGNVKNINQRVSNPYYQFVNYFLLIKPVKNKLLSFKSATVFNRTAQELMVQPGSFPDILNDSLPYDQVHQMASLLKFSSANSASFQTKLGKHTQEVAFGAEYAYKELTSSIFKTINQNIFYLNDSFRNKLHWQNIKAYVNGSSVFYFNGNRLSFSVPAEVNNIAINNAISQFKFTRSYFFANPYLGLLFPLSAKFSADLGLSSKNSIGNFVQTAPGYILGNYRVIYQNDSLLPTQKIYNATLSASYKNPLDALFYTLSVSYSGIKNNITYDQYYDGLFLTRKALLIPSKEKSLLLSSRINKYFISSKTDVSFMINYQWNKSFQMQQKEFVNVYAATRSFTSKISTTLFNAVAVDNEAGLRMFRNCIERINKNKVQFSASRFHDFLRINFSVNNKWAIYSNTEFYKIWDKTSNANSYLFTDFGIRYKYKKLDLEMGCDNIANNKNFILKTISNNMIQHTETLVRGRTWMLKSYFKF